MLFIAFPPLKRWAIFSRPDGTAKVATAAWDAIPGKVIAVDSYVDWMCNMHMKPIYFWLLMALTSAGCHRLGHSPANFRVTSSYPKAIIVFEWLEMGMVSPPSGIIFPSEGRDEDVTDWATHGGTDFGWQYPLPNEVTVVWYEQRNPEQYWRDDRPKEPHRQVIDLSSLNPNRVNGWIVFHLDEEGHWTVRFYPESQASGVTLAVLTLCAVGVVAYWFVRRRSRGAQPAS